MKELLTKEYLESQDISLVDLIPFRKGKPMKIYYRERIHKYADNRLDAKIVFTPYGENKQVAIMLSRVIYAWYKGPVPSELQIDHINNNPDDNRPENLQLLTCKENNRKKLLQKNKATFFWGLDHVFFINHVNDVAKGLIMLRDWYSIAYKDLKGTEQYKKIIHSVWTAYHQIYIFKRKFLEGYKGLHEEVLPQSVKDAFEVVKEKVKEELVKGLKNNDIKRVW